MVAFFLSVGRLTAPLSLIGRRTCSSEATGSPFLLPSSLRDFVLNACVAVQRQSSGHSPGESKSPNCQRMTRRELDEHPHIA